MISSNARAEDGPEPPRGWRALRDTLVLPIGYIIVFFLLALFLSHTALAQTEIIEGRKIVLATGNPVLATATAKNSGVATDGSPDSVLPRFRDQPFWISGQMNFIFQTHPNFHAKYTGANSLVPSYEKATLRVLTLYTGMRLNNSTEVLVHVEEAGGNGLSTALGIAGFSNLDVVRNPTLSSKPYLARVRTRPAVRTQSRLQPGPWAGPDSRPSLPCRTVNRRHLRPRAFSVRWSGQHSKSADYRNSRMIGV